MNKAEIEKLVASAVAAIRQIDNWHGITLNNLPRYMVSPYEVMVDPDDGNKTEPRSMWVILHEPSEDGYLVGYDPLRSAWVVLERTPKGKSPFVQIATGKNLANALDAM
jgi:hypothetical protein